MRATPLAVGSESTGAAAEAKRQVTEPRPAEVNQRFASSATRRGAIAEESKISAQGIQQKTLQGCGVRTGNQQKALQDCRVEYALGPKMQGI